MSDTTPFNETQKISVILIDDDKLICLALQTILEASKIEVLAIGHSAKEAVVLYQQHKPDIMIMDIRMDEETGLVGAQQILTNDPLAKILFLTTFQDDEYIIQALRMGAKGYFLKQNYEGIVSSLYAIESGKSVFGDAIISKIPSFIKQREPAQKNLTTHDLSEKELELIGCVAEGLSNKEIAAKLFLSEGTIRNYLSNVCEKLAIKSRTQLVVYYYNHLI